MAPFPWLVLSPVGVVDRGAVLPEPVVAVDKVLPQSQPGLRRPYQGEEERVRGVVVARHWLGRGMNLAAG